MKTKDDLLKRIEELEAKVRELETRPAGTFHYHCCGHQPCTLPHYPTYPPWPYPYTAQMQWLTAILTGRTI